ncbi:MAG TPA: hypothetical protein VLM11_23515 [Streptosporangiaceae bacterium]|nr:hypothetical protein [Streptosporangiaceae bacterium]
MPGQRRSAGKRARGSWLPRLAGLAVVIVLAAAAVTAYLIAFRPTAAHGPPPLPTRVVKYQTVGLVIAEKQPGTNITQLLQLRNQGGGVAFSPVAQAQQTQGSPDWTADLMAGSTYIFIYLPTGQCLSATGSASQPKLALRHCNLSGAQRWRRSGSAVLSDAHEFYQYANVSDGECLTRTDAQSGQIFGAGLSACSQQQPIEQLLAFWWSAV